MDGLESFFGMDAGEGMDEAAFEQFKERMKANRAHIQALKKGEQKQKKKEDKLVHIILKFIKGRKKSDLVLLVSRVLEQNMPAAFILAIILLGDEEIQDEVGIHLRLPKEQEKEFARLEAKMTEEKILAEQDQRQTALTEFDAIKRVLPLKIKIALDLWGRGIFEAASAYPYKTLRTALNHEKKISPNLIKLTAHVLFDYFEDNEVEAEYKPVESFCHFSLKGILAKVREKIKEQKELDENEDH